MNIVHPTLETCCVNDLYWIIQHVVVLCQYDASRIVQDIDVGDFAFEAFEYYLELVGRWIWIHRDCCLTDFEDNTSPWCTTELTIKIYLFQTVIG